MKTKQTASLALAIGLTVVGLTNRAEAQTVTAISNPYEEFNVGELQNAKFIGVNTPADGVNQDNYKLTLFLNGLNAFSVERRAGDPTIGQVGYSGALSGTTAVNTTEILFLDGGVSFESGSAIGTNAILLQSSLASGDVFDMALVFDIEDKFTYPVSGDITNVFLVCDPTAGSFTMDSALAAAAGGPTAPHVPEPTSSVLLALGGMAFLLRRKK